MLFRSVDHLKKGMTVDFNFRTAASDLRPRDVLRLTEIADFLEQYPDLKIQLDGYADIRGNSDYNLELSQSRLNSVKHLLVAKGVAPERIIEIAHGKANSIEKDHDGYAFERRVSIALSPDESQDAVA